MPRLAFFLSLLLAVCSLPSTGQTEVISGPYSFSIKPKIEPPILELVTGSFEFVDADGNGALDANEACAILFSVTNEGLGDGMGLVAEVQLEGATRGVSCAGSVPLDVAKLNEVTEYRVPVTCGMGTEDGNLTITITVTEPNGFGLAPLIMDLEVRAFKAPQLEVVDFQLSGSGTLQRKAPFTLQALIQNLGQGRATDVELTFESPDGVFVLSANQQVALGVLDPGESQLVEFDCIINQVYAAEEVPFSMALREGLRQFGNSWQHSFALNEPMSTERLVVRAVEEDLADITVQSLRSDVDRELPAKRTPLPHRYALVIGNEDYASRSSSLQPDVNVDFAQNDARSMATYLEHSFGVPPAQIHTLLDATAAEIRREANWLANVARAEGGKAELFFYYSGHGLPAGADQIPHLIPVDVSGLHPEDGIALSELYTILGQYPTQRVQVILDACFSGGARNAELVAVKGIRVVPKADAIPDGMVVWSSSTGNQTSGVNRSQQHGYFTYALLKALQTGQPRTLGDLFTTTQSAVDLTVAQAGGRQEPCAQSSPTYQSAWPQLPVHE